MDHNPIIVALDGMNLRAAAPMARLLTGKVWGFKLNDLYTSGGWEAVRYISQFGSIMLDLKLYDIPNTVKNHCTAMLDAQNLDMKVKIVTVHASGGSEMMKTAATVLPGRICAVTVLTSFDEAQWAALHGTFRPVKDTVQIMAGAAQAAGCSYLVCSGKELEAVKGYKELKKIVPGIRPAWHQKADDQKRTMTPKEAVDAGADYLVLGRPIIEAADPVDAAKRTLEEVGFNV